jgi:flagellar biosynthesis GTPase FlhF
VQIAGLSNVQLRQRLESLKINPYNMHRTDLIANLIKKHVLPNSNEQLLSIRDKHPPSNAWRSLAISAQDMLDAQLEGQPVEHFKTLMNEQLAEAKSLYGLELDSIRMAHRELARDKTNKQMAEERKAAERDAAEREAAERAEAERVEAERAEAERVEAEKAEAERVEAERAAAERAKAARVAAERAEAERVKQTIAMNRSARFASRLTGKTRKLPSQTKEFKIGDRVECRDKGALFWNSGTVVATEPDLLVKTDRMYGIDGATMKWNEVRHMANSVGARVTRGIDQTFDGTFSPLFMGIGTLPNKVKKFVPGFSRKVSEHSVKIGGKRKQTRKRRKSSTNSNMKIGKRSPYKKNKN